MLVSRVFGNVKDNKAAGGLQLTESQYVMKRTGDQKAAAECSVTWTSFCAALKVAKLWPGKE